MKSFEVDTAKQMYEDELPSDIPNELYDWWYAKSYVDVVRIGPSIISSSAKCNHSDLYVLLYCFYEGDSFLIDDKFIGISKSIESLYYLARKDAEKRTNDKSRIEMLKVYLPGQEVPDDGSFGDKRLRYRICKLKKEVGNHS